MVSFGVLMAKDTTEIVPPSPSPSFPPHSLLFSSRHSTMKQLPSLLPELYLAFPNSDVCTSAKSNGIMPGRPSLVQKPGGKLSMKGLLYASTAGQLQRIQQVSSPHASSPLLPAPTPLIAMPRTSFVTGSQHGMV